MLHVTGRKKQYPDQHGQPLQLKIMACLQDILVPGSHKHYESNQVQFAWIYDLSHVTEPITHTVKVSKILRLDT